MNNQVHPLYKNVANFASEVFTILGESAASIKSHPVAARWLRGIVRTNIVDALNQLGKASQYETAVKALREERLGKLKWYQKINERIERATAARKDAERVAEGMLEVLAASGGDKSIMMKGLGWEARRTVTWITEKGTPMKANSADMLDWFDRNCFTDDSGVTRLLAAPHIIVPVRLETKITPTIPTVIREGKTV